MNRSLARLTTRICARMTIFLLIIRVQTDLSENRPFSLAKWPVFEMKSDVLKSLTWDS